MSPKTSISARIDKDLAESLAFVADRKGVSQRHIIEAALTEYLRSPDAEGGTGWRDWRRNVDKKLSELAPAKARRKMKGSGKGFSQR